MQAIRIKSFKSIGVKPTLDLEVNHSDHNFYAEGAVVSNSHSIAYASLSAITVYLKFKYPQQFFLSLLKMTRHEPDPTEEISKIEKELARFGIKLLPPHIILSDLDFTIEGENIRFGLLSVKGISDKSIEKLAKFRQPHANKFQVFFAAEQAGLSIGILSALIQAGSLNDLAGTRSRIVLESQLWHILTEREKKRVMEMGEEFKFDLFNIITALNTKIIDETSKKGNFFIKDSRLATIKKRYTPYKDIYLQNSKSEDFANWFYEKKLLGYTYNKTLKDIFIDKQPRLKSLKDVNELETGDTMLFIGSVKECVSGISKKKNKYMRLLVSDETDNTTVLIFEKGMDLCKNINGCLPKEDNIVIIKGEKKEDCVFAYDIGIQDQKVFTKLSELKSKTDKENAKQEKELTEANKTDNIIK